MKADELLTRLSNCIAEAGDGQERQITMASSHASRRYLEPRPNARHAGVMILLYPDGDQWYTILIKRTSRKGDSHSGQIGLPGGRQESNESLEQCALRETHEEIGVLSADVSIVGRLTQLYVFASNHVVHPYVGILDYSPTLVLSQDEVAEVYRVPMSYWRGDIIKSRDLKVRGYTLKDTPYYDLNGEVLWGATAMIMADFLYIWNKLNDEY